LDEEPLYRWSNEPKIWKNYDLRRGYEIKI
jgi:hypothetical protein